MNTNSASDHSYKRYLLGGGIWFAGGVALFLLDGILELSNLSMLFVLVSALASVCLPLRIAIGLGIFFELMFDWFFIPPRGAFAVEFHQHILMLLVILMVNIIIVSLMALQRNQSAIAARHAREADMLREWSDKLHHSLSPYDYLEALQQLLMQITQKNVALFVLKNDLPKQDEMESVIQIGDTGIEQRHALWYCLRNGQQLGRGTGRYENFLDVYLPMRAQTHSQGSVLLSHFAVHEFSTRIHLQAICDQFGNALERYHAQQHEIIAREQVHTQKVRNNLLAAISHDYRTPLATIMGAASSLYEQTEKLNAQQQSQLAHRIYDEAERLNIITSNILQLARLDADNNILCDWQSAEEILADLLRRWRGRNMHHRLQIHIEKNLPLLWCDAILIGQLLENLVDNALKYSPADSPVIIQVDVNHSHFLWSVIDAGIGVDTTWRDKIFEPFQRGYVQRGSGSHQGVPVIGAGVGLALCRAIASAHKGELRLHCPDEGGSQFILSLPLRELPIDIDRESV